MKTYQTDLRRDRTTKSNVARAWMPLMAGVSAVALMAAVLKGWGGQAEEAGLVAHEWGTFTSVQGGDGRLLTWRPLKSSVLPGFVYDWTKPGLGRQRGFSPSLGLTKAGMITLQRMETPVVYFYTDKPRTVDLEVQFPQGLITEWYPQARQVGPSIIPPPAAAVAVDATLHHNGVSQKVNVESLFQRNNVTNSLIHWSDIELLPAGQRAKLAGLLPQDSSGSHYFAARDTDSAFVRLDSGTNPAAQYEKFLFYRGVASFATPLVVKMPDKDQLSVENSGGEPLRHLFVLRVQNGAGAFVHVDQLQPGAMQSVAMPAPAEFKPLAELKRQLGDKMSAALQVEGLYPREAQAMVNTWKDSWFAENGVRVLYVLPRAWTDRTLPMKLEPAPREVTRVMVGRAEVLAPDIEDQLVWEISNCKEDPEAFARAQGILQELGRFGEPALNLALARTQTPWEQQAKFFAMLDAERNGRN